MINNLKKKFKKVLSNERGEFGISALLSIAIALIVAVFVLLPGITGIADNVVDGLETWWEDTVEDEIFVSGYSGE